jgi:DNA-binding transcriptional ArsR family regulator
LFVVCRIANATYCKLNEKYNTKFAKAKKSRKFVFSLVESFRKMKNNYTEREKQLARFAKAMGHPTRIAILKFLASRCECFFGDINEVLPISKATVSQHLAELKSSGLIQGEIQPPKVKYCINPENWALAKEMFEELIGSYARCESSC